MTFPPIPVYPTAIDSDRTLFLVYNTSETQLAADSLPWSQELTINPVDADKEEIWADNGFANISGELFYYDAVEKDSNGKVFKLKRCARNLGGTQTKLNLIGTWVRGFVVAEHHNQIVDAVLNIENFVGYNFTEDRETLDWRIRNLAAEPIGDDDFQCPNVTLDFRVTSPSTDGGVGTIVNYTLTIDGFFKSFLLDFGDGNFTTSAQTGTHIYAPNSKIDPVVTVSNDNCQVVQTAIVRDEPSEPDVGDETTPFEIDVPEPPDFPTIVIPQIPIPSTTLTLPPIQFPCELGIGPIGSIGDLPSLILVSDDIPTAISIVGIIDFPSIISFTPINIPSTISITPVNIPSVITFGPVPTFPSLITFGPVPTFPSLITFGPVSLPSIITFGPVSIPSVISAIFPSVISITEISLPSIITVNDDIPVTITLNDSLPSVISITSVNIPSVITVNDSIPSSISISVQEDIPTTITVNDSLPSTITVTDSVPSTITVTDSIPSTITVNDSLPSTISIQEDIPTTITVNDSIPSTISVQEDIPTTITVNDSLPSSITVNDSIPETITVNDNLPDTITLTGCNLPSTITVDWGSVPTIPVTFGPCNCVVQVQCPSASPFRAAALRDIGDDYVDPFVDNSVGMQLTSEDLGIPSEIKIIPPVIPDIRIIHDVPDFITVVVPDMPNIQIVGPETPIPSEIRIFSDVAIPSQIELVSQLPESILLDTSSMPTSVKVEFPVNFPTIKIEGDIPKTIQVVGIPDHIELKGSIPSEININIKPLEGLEIPIVYKGGPLPVQFDLIGPAGNEDGKRPCFALVPCGEQ